MSKVSVIMPVYNAERYLREAIYFENFVKIIDDIMENNRDEKNRDHYDQ